MSYMANAITTRNYPPKNSGVLWLDSGGFQALRRGINITLKDIIEKFRRIEANYYIMLDAPPTNGIGSWADSRKNLKLFEELYSTFEDKYIIPVVHHYLPEALEYVLDFYRRYNTPILAIGGSVPGLLNRGKKKAATIIYLSIVRRLWHNSLHILGAGSPIMRCILSYIGADTADTATWRAKAAYGKVIIPGSGERYVGNRNIRYGPLYASKVDIKKLEEFLHSTGFPLIEYEPIEKLLSSFRGRALVNAWTLVHSSPSASRGYNWILKLAEYSSELSYEELISLHNRALKTQKLEALVKEVTAK